jgi:oligopeptide transport system permease protein
MFRFIFSRLLQAIPVLLIIATATFFMVRLAPGGPFSQERQVSPQILEKINEHYGLNDPLYIQYGNYLNRLIHLDLGPSYVYLGRSVNELIRESFPVSLELGVYALLIALAIGLPAGILAALRKNTLWDSIPMAGAMIGICLPTFVLGPILALVFGIYLGWFNVTGWYTLSDRVLPALTLGLFYSAYISRLTRGGMLEIFSKDYIRTARAKGLPEHKVVIKHALKGGLLPVVSYLGPATAGLISGSFVVETIFQIPGLGRHFVNAAFNRDYTMILGTVLFYAVLIVLLNLAVDILQALMNPRLRLHNN